MSEVQILSPRPCNCASILSRLHASSAVRRRFSEAVQPGNKRGRSLRCPPGARAAYQPAWTNFPASVVVAFVRFQPLALYARRRRRGSLAGNEASAARSVATATRAPLPRHRWRRWRGGIRSRIPGSRPSVPVPSVGATPASTTTGLRGQDFRSTGTAYAHSGPRGSQLYLAGLLHVAAGPTGIHLVLLPLKTWAPASIRTSSSDGSRSASRTDAAT